MLSPCNSTSSDSSIVTGIYRKYLKSVPTFTEYYELKLFWVCFHETDFKTVQKFTSIMC